MRSPHSTSEALSASGPLLVNHELVGASKEDLRRQVQMRFVYSVPRTANSFPGEALVVRSITVKTHCIGVPESMPSNRAKFLLGCQFASFIVYRDIRKTTFSL